jgi:hypothetical protein
MNERKTKIEDESIPKRYSVYHMELRGYDSPDRWYEAYCGDIEIGRFGRRKDAIEACKEDLRVGLTDEQKEEIHAKMEWEGADYYFGDYASPKYLEKRYKNKKLVELHRTYLQARKRLFNYVGLEE